MELTLNLVWLALAIAGVLLLAWELSRAPLHPARQPSRRQKILAMTCALIILFFVVSMTDDLHDQEIFVEDNKALRIVSASGFCASCVPARLIPAVFLADSTFASFAPALRSVRRPIDRPKVICDAQIPYDRLFGRAPPAPLA